MTGKKEEEVQQHLWSCVESVWTADGWALGGNIFSSLAAMDMQPFTNTVRDGGH